MIFKSAPAKEIWAMVKEYRKDMEESQKKADKAREDSKKQSDRFRKDMEELRESQKELRESQKELRESQKATDRQMKETDRQMKETGRQMKETDKKLGKMIGDNGNQWGKLGENLVQGNLAKRLKEKGIEVESVLTNFRGKGTEFDIIAINGKEVVVVEVKCTLDPSDVDEFLEKLKEFKSVLPDFKGKTIYGAMAYLIGFNRKASTRARKEGLFVIEATGDVIITNKKAFQPKVF